jgi:hypothetical protein
MTTIEKIVRALLEEYRLYVQGDSDSIVREIVEKESRWATEAVCGFLRALEIPPLPDVEKRLREGGSVQILCPYHEKGGQGKVEVKLSSFGGATKSEDYSYFPLPDYWPFRGFLLEAWAGRVVLRTTPTLSLVKGRAFLKSETPDDLTEVQEGVRAMRSFLATMELEDLEGAIEVLRDLAEGESQYKEPYTLARGGDFWVLRRGLVLGDPTLDGKVLLGGDIEASFPGEVGISFRASHVGEWLYLYNLRISLGEEVVFFGGEVGTPASFIEKNPIAAVIQRMLEREFERVDWAGPSLPLYGVSPKMQAFLRAFAKHKDPFEALAEGKLHLYTTAELFADL